MTNQFTFEYISKNPQWVGEQIEVYESSGGVEGTTLEGLPVVILYTVGAKSGQIRKAPLMRVEHDGVYLAVRLDRRGAEESRLGGESARQPGIRTARWPGRTNCACRGDHP
ncbi:putative nitroreductase [Mycobacteroides abscessus subsp. massiliense]|uniref:Putative nitroreductase n=1 Tax=Mycobacteroides abscessus subsp. massiliense TaxID=1962118 RepID=A0A1T7LYY6_9MYCO|nr:hypothetical protein MMAS_32420 [Mycobacteroides abscessus subsp. massiliense CCUG 48898 = JCM 15300]MBE5403501.1 hypothetical protein [Mycobacteroides abscessus]SIN10615.1 putative nitroreductase [Mycobacteroides abscessus subsp. bolletii]SKD52656.1 nitroreductase [Mycobacteroides abscessus subsp. massiliense]EIV64473.1 putative nitroreductase [Mycobacteroides abscessus subsp. massiliense CCUG 48898 = JCM 15300]